MVVDVWKFVGGCFVTFFFLSSKLSYEMSSTRVIKTCI